MPDPGDKMGPEGDLIDDLTPVPTRPESGLVQRRPGAVVVLVVLVAAVVAVLFQTLGDASLFFYEADRAVELRSELDGDRFR
ncbi:MAG: hypothetical protein GY900_12655, partial [Actinomycetia bacterium]|nr:hypothetical protein [Actinomycetes bacterium]